MIEQDRLSDLRIEYKMGILNISDMPLDPIDAFKNWFDFALAAIKLDANAMVLSTVNSHGRPSSRVVLLKGFEASGFVFFTNYESRKGQNIFQNPMACLNFFWPGMERQIRIEGKVEKISEEASIEYFKSRPRLSQAGAIASNQSEEISDRDTIESRMDKLMKLPDSIPLEKPESWGGFMLAPDYYEFWQGREGRLHDRISYENKGKVWRKFRLSP